MAWYDDPLLVSPDSLPQDDTTGVVPALPAAPVAVRPSPFAAINQQLEQDIQRMQQPRGLQTLPPMGPIYSPEEWAKMQAQNQAPEEQPGVLSDVGNLLKRGYASTAQGINWLGSVTPGLNAIPDYILDWQGNADQWKQTVDEATKAMSVEQQTADKKKFFNDDYSLGDAWTDPRSYGSVIESIPGTVIGMAAGGPITKGLATVGGAILPKIGVGLATEAAASKAVPKLTEKAVERLTMGAGAAGYGASEGLVAAGSEGAGVRDWILERADLVEKSSPVFKDLVENKGYTKEQALLYVADTAASQSALRTGLTTAILGAPMGAVFGKWFHGAGGKQIGKSTLGAIGIGATGETLQEFPQSGFEKFFENQAVQQYADPSRPLDEGVLDAATKGGLAGFIMGGAMGGGGHYSEGAGSRRDYKSRLDAVKTDLPFIPDDVIANELKRVTDGDIPNMAKKAAHDYRGLLETEQTNRQGDQYLREAAKLVAGEIGKTQEERDADKIEQALLDPRATRVVERISGDLSQYGGDLNELQAYAGEQSRMAFENSVSEGATEEVKNAEQMRALRWAILAQQAAEQAKIQEAAKAADQAIPTTQGTGESELPGEPSPIPAAPSGLNSVTPVSPAAPVAPIIKPEPADNLTTTEISAHQAALDRISKVKPGTPEYAREIAVLDYYSKPGTKPSETWNKKPEQTGLNALDQPTDPITPSLQSEPAPALPITPTEVPPVLTTDPSGKPIQLQQGQSVILSPNNPNNPVARSTATPEQQAGLNALLGNRPKGGTRGAIAALPPTPVPPPVVVGNSEVQTVTPGSASIIDRLKETLASVDDQKRQAAQAQPAPVVGDAGSVAQQESQTPAPDATGPASQPLPEISNDQRSQEEGRQGQALLSNDQQTPASQEAGAVSQGGVTDDEFSANYEKFKQENVLKQAAKLKSPETSDRTIKDTVDSWILDGYTEITTQKQGSVTRTVLRDPVSGRVQNLDSADGKEFNDVMTAYGKYAVDEWNKIKGKPAVKSPKEDAGKKKELWETTIAEMGDSYRYSKENQAAWLKSIKERAKIGRIPDAVLDDVLANQGESEFIKLFSGELAKGAEGYQGVNAEKLKGRDPNPELVKKYSDIDDAAALVVEAIRLSGIKQYSGSTLPPTYPNKAFVGHIAEKHNLSYDQNVGGDGSVTLAGRTYKSARKALNAALAIIEEDQAQGTAPNVASPQENEAPPAKPDILGENVPETDNQGVGKGEVGPAKRQTYPNRKLGLSGAQPVNYNERAPTGMAEAEWAAIALSNMRVGEKVRLTGGKEGTVKSITENRIAIEWNDGKTLVYGPNTKNWGQFTRDLGGVFILSSQNRLGNPIFRDKQDPSGDAFDALLRDPAFKYDHELGAFNLSDEYAKKSKPATTEATKESKPAAPTEPTVFPKDGTPAEKLAYLKTVPENARNNEYRRAVSAALVEQLNLALPEGWKAEFNSEKHQHTLTDPKGVVRRTFNAPTVGNSTLSSWLDTATELAKAEKTIKPEPTETPFKQAPPMGKGQGVKFNTLPIGTRLTHSKHPKGWVEYEKTGDFQETIVAIHGFVGASARTQNESLKVGDKFDEVGENAISYVTEQAKAEKPAEPIADKTAPTEPTETPSQAEERKTFEILGVELPARFEKEPGTFIEGAVAFTQGKQRVVPKVYTDYKSELNNKQAAHWLRGWDEAAKGKEQTKESPLASDITKVSEDDFAALIAEVQAELKGETKPEPPVKPATPKATQVAPGVTAIELPVGAAAPKAQATELPPSLANAAKEFGQGAAEAFNGMFELFGGKSKLSSGLTFDEDSYQKAVPHFKKALQHVIASGKELKDFIRFSLQNFGDGIVPYLSRFHADLSKGVITLEDTQDANSPAASPTPADDQTGVAGSKPGEVRATGETGNATGVSGGSSGTDAGSVRRNGQSDNSGTKLGSETLAANPNGSGRVVGNAHDETGILEPNPSGLPELPERFYEDYRLPVGGLERTGSWTETAKRNVDILELATKITQENRPATKEEQELLVKYVGFGAGEIRNKLFPPATPEELDQYPNANQRIIPEITANHLSSSMSPAEKARWVDLATRLSNLLSPEDQKTLLRSTQYAHYTSESIIRSIWNAMAQFGFNGGTIMEPGMGIGSFAMAMPEGIARNSRYMGIEMDGPTAMVAKLLLPLQVVNHADFTKQAVPNDLFDAAIGNPPFAKTVILSDPKYAAAKFKLHDYFFAKTIDSVRPGGLLVFVTSRHTMDKQNVRARKYLSERADFLGAIRLPQTAFRDNAGTDVVTDVIFLRKKIPGQNTTGLDWTTLAPLATKDGEVQVNEYFVAHPDMILGQPRLTGNTDDQGRRINGLHPGDLTVVSYDASAADLEAKFAQAISNLPSNIYSAAGQDANTLRGATAQRDFAPKTNREGALYQDQNGALLRVENGVGVPLSALEPWLKDKQLPFVKDYIDLLAQIRAAKMSQWEDGKWQEELDKLNAVYDAFRKNHGPLLDYTLQRRVHPDLKTVWGDLTQDERAEVIQLAGLSISPTQAWDKNFKAENKRAIADAMNNRDALPTSIRDALGRVIPEEEALVTDSKKFKNRSLLALDSDASIVYALENFNEKGEIVKSPFLKGRTIRQPQQRSVSSPQDALAVSLDQKGYLDLADVATQMQTTEEEAIKQLGDLLYQTPTGQWQLADEYLSGDVVTKLAEAVLAAKQNPELERNIKALELVQPLPKGIGDISANLGAGWINAHYVEDFAREVLNLSTTITYDPVTATWIVHEAGGAGSRNARGTAHDWGILNIKTPHEILAAALSGGRIIISNTVRNGNTTTTVRDEDNTVLANDLVKRMREEFKKWVWTSPDRVQDLTANYNEKHNRLAGRKFDGSHLTLPGLSLRYPSIHPHQLRAIWRIIQTGNTYAAHAVGSGKTLEMIISGMEQRRLGLIQRPVYVVPNHMLEQFSSEFMDAYPTANIMVADDENFTGDVRRRFVARAALNNPDAIILTHSSFKLIGMNEEAIAPIKNKILSDIQDALNDLGKDQETRVLRSRLEQQLEQAEQRFDKMLGAKRDTAITFDELGADFIFYDEAHAARKLDFTTNLQLKGIDPQGSFQALDLYIKTRWLESRNKGRSFVFASGTPVTNTMGELYSLMRFFDEEALRQAGVHTFDAWAAMFGEVALEYEPDAQGILQPVERFSKFNNLPALMSRVRSFMDILTSSQLRDVVKGIPRIEGNNQPQMVEVQKSEDLADYMRDVLGPRLEASRKWKPSKEQRGNPDPIMAINQTGLLASIDMRFTDPNLPNDPNSKLNKMIDEIIADHQDIADLEYVDRDGNPMGIKGGTQIVFYNVGFGAGVLERRGFDARAWVNKRLRDAGIPANEIAWFDDANDDAKKERIFQDMRSGKIKILFGSAKKMGTGVNVQNRLKVLHYLDPPWYPSDVEQPFGRILRQGNQNPTVRIKTYGTVGTYEASQWGILARKMRFIEQALSGDNSLNSMEDISAASMYEQAAAIVAGDPRFKVLADLTNRIKQLEALRAAHQQGQGNLVGKKRSLESEIEFSEGRIGRFKQAESILGELAKKALFEHGEVNGQRFTKRGEFGEELAKEVNKRLDEAFSMYHKPVQVATINNILPVMLETEGEIGGGGYVRTKVYIKVGKLEWEIFWGSSTNSSGHRMVPTEAGDKVGSALHKVGNTASVRKNDESDLANTREELKNTTAMIGQPFAEERVLADMIVERNRLLQELSQVAPQQPVPAEDRLIAIAEAAKRHQDQAKQIALYDTPADYVNRLLAQIPGMQDQKAKDEWRQENLITEDTPTTPQPPTPAFNESAFAKTPNETYTRGVNDIRRSVGSNQNPTGLTKPGFIAALKQAFPHLSGAIDKVLARGERGEKGGTVLIDSNDPNEIARVYAEKTGRSFAEAMGEIQASMALEDRSAANTQIDSTMGSYSAVARNILARIPGIREVLDYGAGKGRGTMSVQRALDLFGLKTKVESFEPFPENWAGKENGPNYTDNKKVASNSKDAVVNLNVLNVVPKPIRDDIVANIGRILKPGGVAVLSSRRWKGDVDTVKNGVPGDEENSYLVTRKIKGKMETNYQKGIEPDELVAYIKEILPGFEVRKLNGYGASAVVIQKPGGKPVLDDLVKSEKKAKVGSGTAETAEIRSIASKLGSGDRDPQFGFGKKMGDELYFHRQYESDLPAKAQRDIADARDRINGFEYNIVRYNTKTGAIAFFFSPDFDNANEPVNGAGVAVQPDGSTRAIELPKKPDNELIYHHKWQWVKDDYQGFNVVDSINRSIAWQEAANDVGINRKRIGFKGIWRNEAIPQMAAINPNISFSKATGRMQGFFDPRSGLIFAILPNLSARSAPAVFLHETGHGQQREDITRRAVELISQRSTFKAPLRGFLDRVLARLEAAGLINKVGMLTDENEAATYIIEQATLEGRQNGFNYVDGKFMDWVDRNIGKPVGDLIRKLVNFIRAAMLRRGFNININKLTVDDLVSFAKIGVERAAEGDVRVIQDEAAVTRSDQVGETFYSAMARAIEALPQQKAPGQQWASILDNLTKVIVKTDATGPQFSIAPTESLDELERISKELDEAGAWNTDRSSEKKIIDRLRDVADKSRSKWVKFLTRQQLVELISHIPGVGPLAQAFEKTARNLDAMKQELKQLVYPVAERWRDGIVKSRDNGYLLSKIIHASTLHGVDPMGEAPMMVAGNTPQERAALAEKLRWHTLVKQWMKELETKDPTLAKVYQESRDNYEMMREKRYEALMGRIGRSGNSMVRALLDQAEKGVDEAAPEALVAQLRDLKTADAKQYQLVRGAILSSFPILKPRIKGALPAAKPIAQARALLDQAGKKVFDAVVADLQENTVPGEAVGVMQKTRYNKLFGQADRLVKEALNPESKGYGRRMADLFDKDPAAFKVMRDALVNYLNQPGALLTIRDVANPNKPGKTTKKVSLTDLDNSAEFQKAFDAVPEIAQKLFKETLESAQNRMADHSSTVKAFYETTVLRGPYAPLSRFGDYQVYAEKDGQPLPLYATFENASEQLRAVKALKEEGWTVSVGHQIEDSIINTPPSGSFIGSLFGMIEETVKSEQEQAILKDDVYQLYLHSLPDMSASKNFVHRKGIPGFSQDALRAYAQLMNQSANAIARLNYSDILQEQLQDMSKEVKRIGLDPTDENIGYVNQAAPVVGELNNSYEWLMNPSNATWANRLTGLGFFWYLTNFSTSLVNLTQTPLMTFPDLAAKFGGKEAFIVLTKTIKDYGNWKFRRGASKQAVIDAIGERFDGDMKRMLDHIEKSGAVSRTETVSLADMGDDVAEFQASKAMVVINKVKNFLSWPFQKSEVANREIAAIAAYTLARNAGKEHQAAQDIAYNVVFRTQNDYSNANRAAFMRGNFARVILLFRSFSQMMTWRWLRDAHQALNAKGVDPETGKELKTIARERVKWMLVSSFMFSGTMGLPIYAATMGIASVIAALGSDPDDPWDVETEVNQGIQAAMMALTNDKDSADLLRRGLMSGPIGSLTGIDLSPRVSMDLWRLWFRKVSGDKEGEELGLAYLQQAAGPVVGGMGVGVVKGMSDLGNALEQRDSTLASRGLETMIPAPLRNALKTLRYHSEGVTTRRGDKIVDDPTSLDLVRQFIGFTPAEIADQYERNEAVKEVEHALQQRRKNLTNRYVYALEQQDQEAADSALEAIREFSMKNPEIAIRGNTLSQAYRQRQRAKMMSENGLYIPSKGMRARLEGEGY